MYMAGNLSRNGGGLPRGGFAIPFHATGMIRILQIRERETDFETERGSDALLHSAGDGFEIARRTIGRGGDWRDVAHGASALRRAESSKTDLIHAFGGRALAVAALGARSPIVFSAAPETNVGTVRWLRAVMNYRRVEVVCPTT